LSPSAEPPSGGDRGDVAVVGLVDRFHRPRAASPRTRDQRPPGYGVHEQCLPFTAAAAAGFLVPAPFSWGCCLPAEAPDGARCFRSPVEPVDGHDARTLYVLDDRAHRFEGNQFALSDAARRHATRAPLPGLSFFDRPDQQDMVKVHLPYLWLTAEGVDLLFMPPINRPRSDGLIVLSGLVETAWYRNPVNLVVMLPEAPASVHVVAGEPLAQALTVSSQLRRPTLSIVEDHRRQARQALEGVASWQAAHAEDRSAYRHLARSAHGRVDDEPDV
jgi:hypothetical protein